MAYFDVKEKECPFKPVTTVYHNDRKNYMVPQHGFNKFMDYDVHRTSFMQCIGEKCAAYDVLTGSCKRLE